MGKLAERLSDACRSGVYRVAATEALEEAAALNGFSLSRIRLEAVSAAALPALAADAASRRSDGRVLLFDGFEGLMGREPGALEALVRGLEDAAMGCRRGRLRFFAAFLDPAALLPLAPLYNWERSRSARAP